VSFTDETLMAFADGALPEEEALRVAAAIEDDAALADRVLLLQEGRDALRGAFAATLAEPVPARLIIAATRPGAGNDNLPRRGFGRGYGAAAAALLIGLALGTALPGGEKPGMLPARVIAALDAAAPGGLGGVQVMASHATEGGTICRSFAASAPDGALLGLACREPEGWRLRAAVARRPSGGDFRPASGTDPVIADVLERLGGGPALDAAEEAAAARRGWLPRR